MAQKRRTYLELNSKFLKDAEKALSVGDDLQASEKLWGAAAEMVKAVASKRGKQLRTHAELWAYVERLQREHPDLNLLDDFAYANTLHQNFYEGTLGLDSVTRGSQVIKDFVVKLKRLL